MSNILTYIEIFLILVLNVVGIIINNFECDSALTAVAAVAILTCAAGRDRWLLSIGLLLSIPGDFCMKNSDKFTMHIFILGIIFFGLAHLCYCIYFLRHLKHNNAMLMSLGILLTGYMIYTMMFLLTPMFRLHQWFFVAGLSYTIISVLSLALACGIGFRPLPRILMILSILGIVISDTIISWTCFVSTTKYSIFIIPLYLLCHAFMAISMLVETIKVPPQKIEEISFPEPLEM